MYIHDFERDRSPIRSPHSQEDNTIWNLIWPSPSYSSPGDPTSVWGSPMYSPVYSPDTPGSPDYPPSPVYAPTYPAYSPNSPAYCPSPSYAPTPTPYSATYVEYNPTSPNYYPSSQSHLYNPVSPPYNPASLPYSPSTPSYSPAHQSYSPTSPSYSPESRAGSPTIPSYTPSSPIHFPSSPTYVPTSPGHIPVSPTTGTQNHASPSYSPITQNYTSCTKDKILTTEEGPYSPIFATPPLACNIPSAPSTNRADGPPEDVHPVDSKAKAGDTNSEDGTESDGPPRITIHLVKRGDKNYSIVDSGSEDQTDEKPTGSCSHLNDADHMNDPVERFLNGDDEDAMEGETAKDENAVENKVDEGVDDSMDHDAEKTALGNVDSMHFPQGNDMSGKYCFLNDPVERFLDGKDDDEMKSQTVNEEKTVEIKVGADNSMDHDAEKTILGDVDSIHFTQGNVMGDFSELHPFGTSVSNYEPDESSTQQTVASDTPTYITENGLSTPGCDASLPSFSPGKFDSSMPTYEPNSRPSTPGLPPMANQPTPISPLTTGQDSPNIPLNAVRYPQRSHSDSPRLYQMALHRLRHSGLSRQNSNCSTPKSVASSQGSMSPFFAGTPRLYDSPTGSLIVENDPVGDVNNNNSNDNISEEDYQRQLQMMEGETANAAWCLGSSYLPNTPSSPCSSFEYGPTPFGCGMCYSEATQ